MPEIIKSGDSGYTAKVDSNNRLFVDSKSFFSEEIAAQLGNAYIWHAECHLAATATGAFMGFTSNDQNYDYAITRIYIDAQTLSNDIIIYQIKNPTLVGGSDITTTGIINKNYKSGKIQLGTLLVSNGVADLTYTDGINYHAFVISNKVSTQRNMLGTIIISNGDTICWGWATLDGGVAVDGEKIAFSVNGYRIPIEEL
jgi:hypothetical protein